MTSINIFYGKTVVMLIVWWVHYNSLDFRHDTNDKNYFN